MKTPLRKRILLLVAVIMIQAIYTPTSLFMEGGIEPKLPWDVFPLQVGWVIPYVACYPLWVFALGWLVWKMDEQRFRRAIAGLFFTCTLGVSIFLLFPTYVTQTEIPGIDFLSKLLLSIQVAGGDHDAFPSAHVYITTILALLYSDWYPQQKWLWFVIVIIVSLSTLFTKQHYIVDVFGGYITGWLGYRFGLWWDTLKFNRMRPAHT
ncbi:MAG: phosphatase PAP2 family protein [Chloroflexi bacterium]|nr:phosphatase PAP2 family protein [Chloroflexota bacterium]